MSKFIAKKTALFLLFVYIFFTFGTLLTSAHTEGESEAAFAVSADTEDSQDAISEGVRISSRIYELLFKKNKKKDSQLYLIPGGEVLGIRLKEEFVSVVAAKDGSAIKRGDKIISIGGERVYSAEDISDLISKAGGHAIKIDILRAGERMTVTTTPSLEDGIYKLGISLRRSASGIGTVTFIDPDTNVFGGLGHGVNEPDGSGIIQTTSGEVCSVTLGSISRGESGKPGELSGVLGKKHYGTIEINSDCGVFGTLENYDISSRAALPVGKRCDVSLGEAEIISTVKNGKTAKYKIEITDIDTTASGSKCFKVKVTDPMLIAITGGIVRGMSGSPIIQNGKLVGAVTHVLVANPTEGYGIFIENMLSAAQSEVIPKAA